MKPSRSKSKTNACFTGRRPRVIGHRGAPSVTPENTIVSFKRAIEDGADILEMDVHYTADGHIVVCHDAMVDRTTDGKGAIAAMTLAQIRKLDAGYRFSLDGGKTFPYRGKGLRIPTLEEVFLSFPGQAITIEIKAKSRLLIHRLVELIEEHNRFDSVNLQVFMLPHKLGRLVRRLSPELVTGYTTAEIIRFAALTKVRAIRLFRSRGAALEVPVKRGRFHVVTPAFVRSAHRLGIEVFVWTIDDEREMKRLLALGVDGLYTNTPATMRRLLDSTGNTRQ